MAAEMFLGWQMGQAGMVVMAAVAIGIGMMTGGCASAPQSSPASTKSAVTVNQYPAPTWVAGPSAPLPEGFPPPGPVGVVVIKRYPECRVAITERAPGRRGNGGLFMPLFRHIETNHIAMSSPVVMTYTRDKKGSEAMESMAFIYGQPTIGQDGADGPVQVVNEPAMLVASIGVRGTYTVGRFERAKAKLTQWLSAHSGEYVSAGGARYLGYNSPFVLPWFKFGEVQIPIRAVSGAATEPTK